MTDHSKSRPSIEEEIPSAANTKSQLPPPPSDDANGTLTTNTPTITYEAGKWGYYFSCFADLFHGNWKQKMIAAGCLAAGYATVSIIIPPLAGQIGATAVLYLPSWMLPYPQIMNLYIFRWLAQEHMRTAAFNAAASNTSLTTALLGQTLHFTTHKGPQLALNTWSKICSLPGKLWNLGSGCCDTLKSLLPSGFASNKQVATPLLLMDMSQCQPPLRLDNLKYNPDKRTLILNQYLKFRELNAVRSGLQNAFDKCFGLVPHTNKQPPR